MEENNKLIAEFIGMQKTAVGWFDNESGLNLPNTMDNTFDSLLFDMSWDWLMSVVEKIEGEEYVASFEISQPTIYINISSIGAVCGLEGIEIDIWTKPKIQAVYEACIEYITNVNKL